MSSEPVSVLGHALLGLLAGRPMSGYDLTRTFDGTLHFVWSAKHAQIYPELTRLARDGYLTQGARGARGRTVYAITVAGSDELRRWLVETRPDRSPRNEVLLRAFFMWSVPAQDARAYFEERERASREALAEFESIGSTFDPKTPEEVAFRVALESGLRLTRAAAEWAHWAAEQYPT
jgi:PadR family transcriptional regulator, regulatory protein AphA